ncbi:MAG: hypothetical protein ABIP94_05555 [Planctomycetota bacterium]
MTTETEQSPREGRGSPGVRATVLTSLPNGMFRLQMSEGGEVVAHAAKDLRKAFTRLLPGDSVLVEVSPFDPNKARICRLLESAAAISASVPAPLTATPPAPVLARSHQVSHEQRPEGGASTPKRELS